jgi:hypothetical protein
MSTSQRIKNQDIPEFPVYAKAMGLNVGMNNHATTGSTGELPIQRRQA